MNILALRAQQKGIELAFDIDPTIPENMVGDAGRLRQIIANLVGNAIKFTDQGEVVLTIKPENGKTDSTLLHFAVRDTGIGIPPEKVPNIFNAFEQADNSTTRNYGGTGLGLTISSKLVNMMQGRIWVESEMGRGSTFHFTARFAIGSVPAKQLRGHRVLSVDDHDRRLRILVAEDNLFNQKVVLGLLKKMGHAVMVANNGREAVDLFEKNKNGYDLVFMDIQMPEMDGFRATELIRREQQRTDIRAPIVAMTAHAMTGDREKCLSAGMDDYISKPISRDELARVMQRNFASAAMPQNRVAGTRPAEHAKNGDASASAGSSPHSTKLHIDVDAVLDRCGGDKELLETLAGMFPAETGKLFQSLDRARFAGDIHDVQINAHTLKGLCGTFEAKEAACAASELEQAARGGNLGTDEQFAVLKTELCRAVEAITTAFCVAKITSSRLPVF
jgi:CheY-like chemotaxis protein